MTRPKFRYTRKIAVEGRDVDAMHVAERAALMGKECPPDGNPFHHIRIELDVHVGNGNGLAVWTKHRKEILIDPHRPGCRPAAFWIFDAPPDTPQRFKAIEPTPSQQEQAMYLHTHGLLSPAERKRLPKDWFAPSTPRLKVIPNGR